MEQVNASIARYLRALDRADREEGDVAEAKSGRLKEKIAGLRRQMQALKAIEQAVQDAPDQQVSLTDPDARSMATSGKGTATVGYNVQIAVDAEHHLIVASTRARPGRVRRNDGDKRQNETDQKKKVSQSCGQRVMLGHYFPISQRRFREALPPIEIPGINLREHDISGNRERQ